jgi:hypothetical protein
MLTTDPLGYSALHRIEPKASGLNSRRADQRSARESNNRENAGNVVKEPLPILFETNKQ